MPIVDPYRPVTDLHARGRELGGKRAFGALLPSHPVPGLLGQHRLHVPGLLVRHWAPLAATGRD